MAGLLAGQRGMATLHLATVSDAPKVLVEQTVRDGLDVGVQKGTMQ